MSYYQSAYRTTCTPTASRLDTVIPSEYVGQEIEITIMPLQPKYHAETLAAMQETLDIMDGKIKTKQYETVEEMHADIDAEEDDDV